MTKIKERLYFVVSHAQGRFLVDSFRVAQEIDPRDIPPPLDTLTVDAPLLLIVEPGGGYVLFGLDLEGNPFAQKFAKVRITFGGKTAVVCSMDAPRRVFHVFPIQDIHFTIVGGALPVIKTGEKIGVSPETV